MLKSRESRQHQPPGEVSPAWLLLKAPSAQSNGSHLFQMLLVMTIEKIYIYIHKQFISQNLSYQTKNI